MEATVGDQIGVILDRSDARDADNFYWTTRQVTFGGNTYLEISGGKFYFDYGANSIVIPDQYLDPTDGNLYSVWELNSDLYGDPNGSLRRANPATVTGRRIPDGHRCAGGCPGRGVWSRPELPA